MDPRKDLLQILESAIDSVRPAVLFPRVLKNPSIHELTRWESAEKRFLLCIGKASLSSASSILGACDCQDYFVLAPSHGSVTGLDLLKIGWGSHPIPDERSLLSAQALLSWLKNLPPEAPLLIVLSGGSSALMVLPAEGISLASKMKVNELLIRCGANIHEINAVRKHLSGIKGGQLSRHLSHLEPLVLVISDVIGNDLSTIGSGPFYPDQTTFSTALSVLKSYGIWDEAPGEVKQRIEAGIAGTIPETPKGDPSIAHYIIASNEVACSRATETATALGYEPQVIPVVSGLVDDVANRITALIDAAPAGKALIFGGEVTVKLSGSGTGGRNQHLALLMADRIRGRNVAFAAIGTDGIDGNSPAAGAWVDGNTADQAAQRGLDLQKAMREFDSFPFFRTLDRSIITGPSGTNVMDLYLALT